MTRVVVLEPIAGVGLEMLTDAGLDLVDATRLDPEAREAAVAEAAAVIIRSGSTIDATFLDRAPRLRAVARAGVGLDNVDLAEATRRGVAVINTPGGNAVAAAEHTLAVLLSLARHVPRAHGRLVDGGWDRHEFVGVELSGRVLGLVGVGRVGGLVAERARAFDMEVLAYDPYLGDERAKALGVARMESLDDLLARADVVSLHLPLTAETANLFDAARLAGMKKGALLVNCARGGLIDEAALAASLRDGHLRGAALDVFSQEPPRDSPLVGLDTVVHTPHLGASTLEAKENVGKAVARGLVALLVDGDYSFAVNLPHGGPHLRALAPWLDLARRLGRFQGGLLDGAPRRVEVEVAADDIPEPDPLAQAFLAGLLEVVCGTEVNAVNARLKADELGIAISQTRGPAAEGFPRRIGTRVDTDGTAHHVEGSLLAPGAPRIVRVDGRWMDVEPIGDLLVLWNRDQPGVIGKVGTLLGQEGINIGELRLGREAGSDLAISVWQVDQPVGPDLVGRLKETGEIQEVRQARLGDARTSRRDG